jgi:hypothetical protein
VLVLLVLPACADLRVKEGVYNTLADARTAGAVADGWVPDGLPASAADFREGHLPDGRHWGVFTFATADGDAVRALVGSEMTAGTVTCSPPRRLVWWPQLIHSPVDVERVRSTGFRLYTQPASGLTFAINWGQGRAYYWKE